MNKLNDNYILKGDISYSTSINNLETLKDAYVICVDGKSKGVFKEIPEEYKSLKIYDYSNKLIIPGLVDLHIHASQYSYRGMGMDLELMEWLNENAFPEESKYQNLEYAKKSYQIFANAIKKSATTHLSIFATRHRLATEALMEQMEETGLISYIGKINMDKDDTNLLNEESAEHSYIETVKWIEKTKNKFENTKPILTPRFIPSCTTELLEKLYIVQNEYNIPVQSHLSENLDEIAYVNETFPNSLFYGDVYNKYGLFGGLNKNNKDVKTLMAHCVYSSDKEIKLMKDNNVFVVHCPASNTNISSGIAPMRKYINEGLNIGLGSDVAGGHTESMFRAITDTIQVSKLYWRLINQNYKPLNFEEAFYLATKGGGKFFGNVGSFEENFDFSAVVLNTDLLEYPFEHTVKQRLESAIYNNLDLYGVIAKFVKNKKII